MHYECASLGFLRHPFGTCLTRSLAPQLHEIGIHGWAGITLECMLVKAIIAATKKSSEVIEGIQKPAVVNLASQLLWQAYGGDSLTEGLNGSE
jgi:hypothetical protein